MNNQWIPLTAVQQIEEIRQRSFSLPCLIFKHSTRCNISTVAQYRLNDDWNFAPDEMAAYYLDLIAHREVSNAVSETFSVHHESPQVLLIRNGECVYDESHLGIRVDEIRENMHLVP